MESTVLGKPLIRRSQPPVPAQSLTQHAANEVHAPCGSSPNAATNLGRIGWSTGLWLAGGECVRVWVGYHGGDGTCQWGTGIEQRTALQAGQSGRVSGRACRELPGFAARTGLDWAGFSRCSHFSAAALLQSAVAGGKELHRMPPRPEKRETPGRAEPVVYLFLAAKVSPSGWSGGRIQQGGNCARRQKLNNETACTVMVNWGGFQKKQKNRKRFFSPQINQCALPRLTILVRHQQHHHHHHPCAQQVAPCTVRG